MKAIGIIMIALKRPKHSVLTQLLEDARKLGSRTPESTCPTSRLTE